MAPLNIESESSNKNLETLLNENRDLRRQLAELNARNQTLQTLLVEISRKLQISSASIKAAVSSMLALDFFWDESTQHEFLETIDNSVDQISSLIRLVTLAFRSEIPFHIHRASSQPAQATAASINRVHSGPSRSQDSVI